MMSRFLSFALVFALPLAASAQITAHPVKLTLKTVSQTTNNNDDLKPDKFGANWKDVFQACVGTAPAKDEGLFLFIDCQDVNNNMLAAMDTNPVNLLADIGGVSLDLGHAVYNEKNGLIQSVSVPAAITIDCEGASAEVTGIMDIKYKDLDGTQCPNSASAKVTGATDDPETSIVDNGSSVTAEKRTLAVGTGFPAP
jgi:hypothetical protein